jgi:hypothetical protein
MPDWRAAAAMRSAVSAGLAYNSPSVSRCT